MSRITYRLFSYMIYVIKFIYVLTGLLNFCFDRE